MASATMLAISAGVSAASGLAEGIEGFEGSKSRERALSLRMQQEQIASNENSINRMDAVNRIMASQNAGASATGNLSSSSFNAVQMGTLDEFSKDENASALNLSFQKQADLQGEENQRASGLMSLGNSAFSVGKSLMNMYSPSASKESGWESAGEKAINNSPEI